MELVYFGERKIKRLKMSTGQELEKYKIIQLLKDRAFEWIKGKNLLGQPWEWHELWEAIAIILIASGYTQKQGRLKNGHRPRMDKI